MTQTEGPVVVGVDGTPRSVAADTAAVDLGAWEAGRRHVALHLLIADRTADPTPEDSSADRATLRHQALDRLVERTAIAHPDLAVTATQTAGGMAGALVAAATSASLVIIAADARVHYGGLLAGLVSIQVAAHARTPVIVVSTPTGHTPTTAVPAGTVIVGIDGSAGAHDAIAFAFDEAQARGATLHAIHVDNTPPRHGRRSTAAAQQPDGSTPSTDTNVGDTVRLWQNKYPDVTVVSDVVRADGPVRALNTAAGPADLIVVGARGAGGFASLALGSVSDGLVRYARCAVAVVAAATTGL